MYSLDAVVLSQAKLCETPVQVETRLWRKHMRGGVSEVELESYVQLRKWAVGLFLQLEDLDTILCMRRRQWAVNVSLHLIK